MQKEKSCDMIYNVPVRKETGNALEISKKGCFLTECEVEIKKYKKTLDKKGKESIIITRDCQEVTKRRAQYFKK